MKAFKVTGSFKMGRKFQKFSKEVAANDEKLATEYIFSDLGSKHSVKRYNIIVEGVTELKPDEITNPVIEFKSKRMKE
jgi:large subunit ribosomal protein LX